MKMSFCRRVALAALLMYSATAFVAPVQAQPAPPAAPVYSIAEHYTRYEFRIPMRDGARLFTAVYLPKDTTKTYPFLMVRTPYGVGVQNDLRMQQYGVDAAPQRLGPSEDFDKAGYIFVDQDVRGRFKSEGIWTEMQPHNPDKKSPKDTDASTDMFDTVEWLLKNVPGHNGRVGIWGISYPGFYVSASIIDSHPAIKAASPQAPVTDLYMNDDSYHNGAFMLGANYGFYTFFRPQPNPIVKPERFERFDYGTTSAYDYFLKLGTLQNIAASLKPEQRGYFVDQMSRPNYDAYWKSRDISRHLKNVKAAVLTVGGWFDAEDPQGPLTTFKSIAEKNPGTPNHLVMGPWAHGGWARYDGARLGNIDFASRTADYYRKSILFPFFEKHLRDQAEAKAAGAKPPVELAKATVFETGTNVWRRFDTWPPAAARTQSLYFQPGGKLGFDAPAAVAGSAAYDEYLSDPARPVPYLSYPSTDTPQEFMVGDQRFASTRPDVLVYQTEPLENDLGIAGTLQAKLFVSTTGSDADWVVKLIDVFPPDYPDAPDTPRTERPTDVAVPRPPMGGYQMLVRGEPMRGKFRNSFEKPEPFVPGAVTPVNFSLPDIAHTFRRGHRVMVQVQSSWFPLVDRNPQVFVDIPGAKPEDFRAATHRVFHTPAQPSGLQVQVLPGIGQ
jgi:uncharacterized protein